MRNLQSRDALQMAKLAAAPSSWRILNLYQATHDLRERFSDGAGTFFQNRRLAESIIIKHTLRDHERDMFDTPPVVATKVLVPLQGEVMDKGAISFFVGERAYQSIMRQSFGIRTGGIGADLDARILGRLNDTPSLDLFLLRELLALHPQDVQGMRLLALILQSQGKSEEAISTLHRAIEIAPTAAHVHADLGALLRSISRPQEAAVSLRRALDLVQPLADRALHVARNVGNRCPRQNHWSLTFHTQAWQCLRRSTADILWQQKSLHSKRCSNPWFSHGARSIFSAHARKVQRCRRSAGRNVRAA